MNFVIDAQLPPALAKLFRNAGHSCVHVADVGLNTSRDRSIWNYAMAQKAFITSKDEDFVVLKSTQPNGPAVVWLRVGNCSNRALMEWLEPLLPHVLARLENGDGLIEVK